MLSTTTSMMAAAMLSSAQLLLVALAPGAWAAGTPASCPNAPLSCHNPGPVVDTCCFNSPGGQLLQTQFWDTHPSTGPSDSWTIHGLWPDKCDGTFESYCDRSRAYTNIGATIGAANPALLSYMNTYWKDYKNEDEDLWEHEWGKHGTCISTLRPNCYTGYTPREELVDFFETTVNLFKALDTYEALAAAGITPSKERTYTSSQIQDALRRVTGHPVTIGCKSGSLKEVFYHFNVRGSVQTGTFIATDPDGSKSTCPQSGIKYVPK